MVFLVFYLKAFDSAIETGQTHETKPNKKRLVIATDAVRKLTTSYETRPGKHVPNRQLIEKNFFMRFALTI